MAVSTRRTKDLFAAALEHQDGAARRVFLDRECADDPELRQRLEVLLQAHDAPASVLDRPFAEISSETLESMATVEPPMSGETAGVVIAGRYKLIEEIGEGGMGTVWMAQQQEPVKRLVAVKLIKPGMDSTAVLARFEVERRALALMDHASIAKVLDAGATDSGRPYFVMELVKGAPITRYCDEHRLTLRQRLELFIPVCQAMQHAHQKGIIHRDLKPSNVLVALYDGKPVPKVIDFGVAKAAGQSLTDKTLVTGFGSIVGTPEYMSPEQAELNQLDIDTRSDVYALGVLLYELLAGNPPFSRKELTHASMLEMLRIIREREPSKPSTKLSATEGLPVLAAKRSTEPARLARLMRGELDWIVMKALDKERSRRYETANGLAEDLRRYLVDEPVQACPPSAWYRFRKFACRNKAAVMAASALAVAALVALAALAVSNVMIREEQARTKEEKDRAEKAQQLADQRADEIREGLERLQAANAWRDRGQLYAEQLRWGEAHAALAKAIDVRPDHGTIWVERGDLYTRLGLWDLAAADFARAFELGEPDSTMRWYRYALLRLDLGDADGYRALCRKMRQRFGRTNNPFFLTEVVRTSVLSPPDDVDLGEVVRIAERRVAADPQGWYPLYLLGLAHYRAGQHEPAVRRLEASLAGKPDWDLRALSYPALAMAHHRLGQAAQARQALESAARAIDRWTQQMCHVSDWRWMDHHDAMGHWPITWWDWLECQLYYREARRLIDGSPPGDDPRIHVLRARALAGLRRPAEAAREYAFALELSPHDPQIRMEAHRNQAYRLVHSRQWERAAAEFDRACALQPDDVYLWLFGAVAHLGAGDVEAYRRACSAMIDHFASTRDARAARYAVYACVMRADTLADMKRLLPLARTADPAWNGETYMLAAALYRASRYDEAVRFFDAATKTCPPRASHACFGAMAHYHLGNVDEARRYLAEAARWIAAAEHAEQDPGGTRPAWADWYEPILYSLLYQEAEAVINNSSTRKEDGSNRVLPSDKEN